MLKHGLTAVKKIKKEKFQNWTETEIRLRICRLIKYYNLPDYEGRKFSSKEELFAEAKKNRAEAIKAGKELGGIYYNPPPLENDVFDNLTSKSKK